MQQGFSLRRALLSVADKIDILEFAKALSQRGVEILSTGGTASILLKAGLPVTKISNYINFPEIMNGRIKTLHPKIHGGILARRGRDEEIMAQHNILPIDMVVVNLYPFEKIVSQKNCLVKNAIENIDIGGLTMVRAAAKNYEDVAIVVHYSDYSTIIQEMDTNNNLLTMNTRFSLAVKAFQYTANYDSKIASYFSRLSSTYNYKDQKSLCKFPENLNIDFIKKYNMRYGENMHQAAAFYIEKNVFEASVSNAKQIQGKTLSYNNIVDADTALECIKEFDEPACVIVKHGNPCGVAVSHSIFDAYERAYNTDPDSAFGGIIALNRSLDKDTANTIIKGRFTEVIITPSITSEVLKITSLKKNIRILIYNQLQHKREPSFDFKRVNGGLLVQDRDIGILSKNQLRVVSKRFPTESELKDAIFCWKVAKFVKSNAIVYGYNNTTTGIGAGQMSRIFSAKIASIKAIEAGLNLKKSVMASDAFLPFRDNIDTVASLGISCIIQPGGSIRDNEVIEAADDYNIAMIFTSIRHFRH